MSSVPLASTCAGLASAVDPAGCAPSHQDRRADPIARSSSCQSSQASLSSHRTTQLAPPLAQAPPPPAPAVQAKPAQQKKKLSTRLSSRTVTAPDFPVRFKGKWYSNPDTYAKRHPDSPQATILFASCHPQSEEAKL